MFGYVKPDKSELRIKEYEAYKSVYCALCKELGKNYGIISRLTLNYDYTFLALLCLSLCDTPESVKAGRCVYNPLKKCNYLCGSRDKLQYACAVSVLMLYYKIYDNICDRRGIKKLFYKILLRMYKKQHIKAAKVAPEVELIISDGIKKQQQTEQKPNVSLDEAGDGSALMLAKIFECISEENARALYRLGYCLGKWVYITDAVCDIEKDIKQGSFNPLKAKCQTVKEAKKMQKEN
ncbi:MAG: hypothetical protein KBS41_05500, partial [Oscillospiraceae bacterium]|nr:hypothetical protein [Candidatus Equicaccousia limihippi]